MGARDDVLWAGIDRRREQVIGEDAQRWSDHDPTGQPVVSACQRNIGSKGIAAGVQHTCFVHGTRRIECREKVIALGRAAGMLATTAADPAEIEAKRCYTARGKPSCHRGNDIVLHIAAELRMRVRDGGYRDRVDICWWSIDASLEARSVAAGDRYRRRVQVVAHDHDTVPFAPVAIDDRLPIKMLADRILVKIDGPDGERRSSGGILIPATAQMSKRLTWAEVVGLGPNVRSMEVGDRVLFSPEDRYEVEVRGDDYIILRERDVHAVAAKRLDSEGTGLYL